MCCRFFSPLRILFSFIAFISAPPVDVFAQKESLKFYHLTTEQGLTVQMPEMDGLETTRFIREHLSEQPVIVAMTANAMIEDREACLKAGMNDYLSKPMKLQEIILVLEKWNKKSI
jgi:DNA-binding NarL/FixJ family response regulator